VRAIHLTDVGRGDRIVGGCTQRFADGRPRKHLIDRFDQRSATGDHRVPLIDEHFGIDAGTAALSRLDRDRVWFCRGTAPNQASATLEDERTPSVRIISCSGLRFPFPSHRPVERETPLGG
jgi:hypothetical protein